MILVLNCGSSSVKYGLFDGACPVASGKVERIGEAGSPVADHEAALEQVADRLGLASLPLDAVGHRVVHGGAHFRTPVLVDDDVLAEIRALTPMAPLHNPANVEGIELARRRHPDVPHFAVFDTAFHATLPAAAATYALDRSVASRYGIRRYGFHGISFAYVSRQAARLLDRSVDELNMVVLHLGNGASAVAIRGGRSVETSMGFTPLEGLVMGSRTGDIDPAVALLLARQAGLSVDDLDDLYQHRSGLRGLCGDNDMRTVIRRATTGDPDARLALDVYCHRIRKYVGAYYAVLGRLDAIVFTAGIGENSPYVRATALAGLEALGIAVDPARNDTGEPERVISPDGTPVAICVVPTDEERAIAEEISAVLTARANAGGAAPSDRRSSTMGSGLLTDLYEVRMAASYLRRGMDGPAAFSLYVRALPPDRGFLVTAGLADALSFLADFHLDDADLEYLRTTRSLPDEALDALRGLRFTGDVRAVPEGRIVFAGEPLLEVTGPIAEAQLVETALLNAVTYQTALASKAARCRLAGGGADLVDFAFRRTHGVEAAFAVARTSAIAGFSATSNVEAARRYGLVPTGTMAHSYVQAFGDDRAAFTAFATDYPGGAVFLVDTYDTLHGVRAAIDVARNLRLPGPIGVRLDSGDFAGLAIAARRMLDEAGLPDARIVASGGLDEYAIADLVAAGVPIDAYGIGTKLGVSADAPILDSAYKLVAYADRPVMKLSPGKISLPGPKQVFRGDVTGDDLIGLRSEQPPAGRTPLLVPVMTAGQRLAGGDEHGAADDLTAARRRFDDDLSRLPEPARRLRDPIPPVPRLTPALDRLREDVQGGLLDRLAMERLPASG